MSVQIPTISFLSPLRIFSLKIPISEHVPLGSTSPSMQAISTSVLSSLWQSASAISLLPANLRLPSTPLISVFSSGSYKLQFGNAYRISLSQ